MLVTNLELSREEDFLLQHEKIICSLYSWCYATYMFGCICIHIISVYALLLLVAEA